MSHTIAGARGRGDGALAAIVLASPLLGAALQELDGCGLPDWCLGAGAVAQTVWNALYDRPDGYGISDLDVVYFEPGQTAEAEREVERMVSALLARLDVRVDVKNQARVHLWYEEAFGSRIRPYRSIQDAMSTWPATATAVGVHSLHGELTVRSVFGLSDLFDGIVRANRVQVPRAVFEKKAARWARRWPELRILPWADGVGAVGERTLDEKGR